LSLGIWGAKWAGGSGGRGFLHSCGQMPLLDYTCHFCGEPVGADNVTPLPIAGH
jgi:hypothetical protein